MTERIYCSTCGEILTEGHVIPLKEHDWDQGTVVISPTCEDAGKKVVTCKVCGISNEEEIPSSGHTEETIPASEPTCTENGLSEGKKCSVCGEILEEQHEIPALGHEWSDPIYSWSEDSRTATALRICSHNQAHEESETVNISYTELEKASCTEAGSGIYTASFENEAFTDQTREVSLPPNGHKEEMLKGKTPTCTEKGLSDGKICSVCGVVLEPQKEIPALDHEFTDWVETSAPSCSEEGTKERICSHCGKRETESISKVSHIERTIPGKDATCIDSGLTEGSECSVCGEILVAQKTIPATGHKWDSWKVTTEPTIRTEGVRTYTCSVCGEQMTEPIAKLTVAPDPALGTVSTMEGKAENLSENGDPAGSTFRILQVKSKKVGKTAITIAWKPVQKAAGYLIFGAPCGSRYRKLADVKAANYKQGGLKKGTYYKYLVSAYDEYGNILASSKTVHIATSGGKKGNTKSVRLNKKKVTLKKGKSIKLKATLKNGKLKVSKHRKVAFETDKPSVATVSGSGKIKAVGKGTCYIYAYAQNGVFAKCKVTVK